MSAGRFRIVLLPAALLALTGGLWAHEGHKAIPTRGITVSGDALSYTPEAARALGLAFAEVETRTVSEWSLAAAETVLSPRRHAHAAPAVRGTVTEVRAKAGDSVEAGAVLALLRSPELAELQAELAKAGADRKRRDGALARARPLAERGIVSRKELLALESEAARAALALASVRSRLGILGLEPAQVDAAMEGSAFAGALPVRSPISGIVARADAAPGRAAGPDRALFDIVDASVLWLEIRVPETAALRVRAGQPVRFLPRSRPGIEIEGTVLRAEPALGTDGTVTVWAELAAAQGGGLRPGAFGACRIRVGSAAEAVAAPRDAVVAEGPERYTFVREKEGTLVRRRIRTGLREPAWVEIRDGLRPGDSAAVTGQRALAGLFASGGLTPSPQARLNADLLTEEILVRPLEAVVSIPAVVTVPPGARAQILPPLEGRVLELLKLPGETVRPGEAVATLQSLPFERLQADFLRALSALAQARADRDRVRLLADQSIASGREAQDAEAAERQAAADSEGARQKLRAAGLADAEIAALEGGRPLPALPVRSPIAGTLSSLSAVLGQGVGPETPLAEVIDAATVWIEGAVPPRERERLGTPAKGRVRVHAVPGRVWEGAAAAGGPAHEEAGRASPLWIGLKNEDGLLPGMRGTIHLPYASGGEVLAVPADSLLKSEGETFVFVEEKGTFRKRKVVPGRRNDLYVEALPGSEVLPGDRAVARGQEEILTAFKDIH